MPLPEDLLISLPKDSSEFLSRFFVHCPHHISMTVSLLNYGANKSLITADETCSQVYILLKGRLQGVEERGNDTPYRFNEMVPIQIVGDFELFTNTARSYISLITLEPCTVLMIPAKSYLPWIRTDANALFMRTTLLMQQLTSQSRKERQFLFLDNKTRLLVFIQRECQKYDTTHTVALLHTRSEIASVIGCSVRTLNRIIPALAQSGYITMIHGKIWVTKEQMIKIEEHLKTIE